MARRKAFMLRIEIDIHSVHYQEISLCHSGNLALRVHTLNSTAVTMPAYPSFPIHFHEKLIFEKIIDCVTTLAEIQDHLSKESLKMELVQWPRHYSGKPSVIAHFRTKLSSLLFPTLIKKDFSDGGDIKLLMEPTKMLPESPGPRVDVSTKTTVEETTSHRPSYTRVPAREVHSTKVPIRDVLDCCRHSNQLPSCGCRSVDHYRRKQRSRCKKSDDCRCLQIHETASANDCCICNCYSGYFDPKPYLGFRSRSCSCMESCQDAHSAQRRLRKKQVHALSPVSHSSSENYSPKTKFTHDDADKPIPYRQLFYENLDYFYRKLRDKTDKRILF